MPPVRPLRLAIATALLASLPAAGQQNKTPPTNLYIDVLTHNMMGMPDMGEMMGGLGGLMARRMAGPGMGQSAYPSARTGGMTGQYLDIALHNTLKPGVEAQELIPAGLNLGKTLILTPPEFTTSTKGGPVPGKIDDIEIRITEYWGCGTEVRPGQPKVSTFRIKGNGKTIDPRNPMASMEGVEFQASGSPSAGLYAPDRDIDLKPGWVYWPNRKHGKQVPSGARLAGEHKLTGDGIPASMQFQIAQSADFMPKLMLRALGEPAAAVMLDWPAVARARAYFISGMRAETPNEHSVHLTLWSSADVPGASSGAHAYLSGSFLEKWLKQKVLLPATATRCSVPKGIFAGTAGGQEQSPAMLMMTAYGPENWISYPPKPTDPKQPWNPEWSVRLRAKSTATAMLGMDMEQMPQDQDSDEDEQSPTSREPENVGKKLLRGIFGRKP